MPPVPSLKIGSLLLVGCLLGWAGVAWAQEALPSFRFVSASGNTRTGDKALDQDRDTAWIGIAKRSPAWYVARLSARTRLTGILVTTAKMPANTFYRLEVSEDGSSYRTVLENLRNENDAPVMRTFSQEPDVLFLRIVFENGSRQPFIAFALRELTPVPAPGPLGELPASAPTTMVPGPQPSATPARLLGAVLGTFDGRRTLVIVGDNFSDPIEEVQVEGRTLKVLDSSETQILCDYPFARSPRMSLNVQVGGRRLSRTVSVVNREIRWTPASPQP